MKILKKGLIYSVVLAAAIIMSGCSAMETYTGYDFGSIESEYKNTPKPISYKHENFEYKKGSSYVVYSNYNSKSIKHPAVLWEVVDGKIKVVNFGDTEQNIMRLVSEVTPGKHTYIKNSSCGLYQITIDVKEGYTYSIKRGNTSKPSKMSWCRTQGKFMINKSPLINATKFSPVFVLIPENQQLAQEVLDSSGLQEAYVEFEKDIKNINQSRNLYMKSDDGYPTGMDPDDVIDYYKAKN